MSVHAFLRPLRAGALVALFNLVILASSSVFAMPAAPFPHTETQPDGTEITLHARGDEHYNWMEDADGYTVVRNNGWFEYAVRGPAGRLNANGMIVGRDNPNAGGLQKHILPSAAVRAESVLRVNGVSTSEGVSSGPEQSAPTGNVKSLVVMIRFSDHVGRTLPSAADVDVLFNTVGGDPVLAPTGSIKDVYFENSYGQMTLNSFVNPGIGDWITVSNTEAYYANGNSGDSTLWQALREALDVLDAVIDFGDFDADNDGRIDSIAFIHSGYGAEWGGNDVYGTSQANRIWSHRWAIQPQWNSNDGVSVFDYHISPGVWGTSGSSIGRIGVIAHETGHFFGLPDLYDTNGGGQGIGSWGLMANSWDFNGTQYCPPHFSPWSKIDLGWSSATIISQPGQYTINQTETNAEIYRIDNGFSSGEYLLIENRQNAGFDCTIPQGGIAIWHIDDTTSNFNTEGYPGQGSWPANGNHYRVALLQADGNYNLEKGNNRGDYLDMHHAAGVDAIGPGPGNHPNTDTYKNGTVTQTGIIISDMSASGASMTFCYNGCTGVPAPSGLSATAQSTSLIALGWADNSGSEDGFTIERSSDGSSWSALTTVVANTTSYNNSGLSPAQTWFYRVRAFEAGDVSAWSNTASATTDDIPPATPSGLSASAVSDSQINLNWVDQAGNEDGYRVEWSPNGTGSWAARPDLGANSTSYSHTGLTASTGYFYRVVAFNSAGDSGFSATASATTDDPPPFVDYFAQAQSTAEGSVSGGFSNTHADDGNVQSITEKQSNGNPSKRRSSLSHRWTFNVAPGNSMTLTANAWSGGSNDNDEFQFQWSTDGSTYTNTFLVSSTSSSNQQSMALPASLSGTVYVRVVDSDNQQGNSAQDAINIDYLVIRADNTPVTPPADPTGMGAVAVAHNQVDLVWTDNANDETGCEVERALSGGSFSPLVTLAAGVSSYTDTTVSELTSYDYRVRAIKGATASGFSNTTSATTPEQPAGSISLSAVGFKVKGKHNVDLTWSGSAATNVDIYRDSNLIATTTNDGTYTDNIGAKGGATYQYEVCDAGTSNCSITVTVVF
jgi:M6 family metalloprotease-like protein